MFVLVCTHFHTKFYIHIHTIIQTVHWGKRDSQKLCYQPYNLSDVSRAFSKITHQFWNPKSKPMNFWFGIQGKGIHELKWSIRLSLPVHVVINEHKFDHIWKTEAVIEFHDHVYCILLRKWMKMKKHLI